VIVGDAECQLEISFHFNLLFRRGQALGACRRQLISKAELVTSHWWAPGAGPQVLQLRAQRTVFSANFLVAASAGTWRKAARDRDSRAGYRHARLRRQSAVMWVRRNDIQAS
jgi:transposase